VAALRAEADLVPGILRRALAGAAAAGLAGLMAGALIRVLVADPPPAGRAEALARLLPEGAALLVAGALVAIAVGAIRRDDAALLRDVVPSGAGGRP
jgi:hypothetical protein